MPTRRHFLQATSAAGLSAAAALGQTRRPVSANDTIQIALIGAGTMGSGDVQSALAQPGVKIVAAADVYDGRLERARERWGKDLFTTRDYREVLARPDIDAVIIATPDHWHAQMSVDAMNAGKDVYCQKPMVQKVEDGKRVIDAQQKNGRILQVGSQRVSSVVSVKAKELLKEGAIGKLNMVEAWWDRYSAIGAWQYTLPLDASTETIDWDRFLGSAPRVPFEPVRLFRWRNYRDYGTGVAGDLYVHLFSSLHFIASSLGPERVFGTGGLRYWKDGREVPDVMIGLFDYPETKQHPAFNLALRVNFVSGGGDHSGVRFIGSDGMMTVGQGVTVASQPRETEPGYTIETFPKDVQQKFLEQYRKKYPSQRPTADAIRPRAVDEYLPPRGYSDDIEHHRVFFEAVRSRKPVVEDAAFGLRAAGPALLSNVSHFQNKVVQWDAQTMTVKG